MLFETCGKETNGELCANCDPNKQKSLIEWIYACEDMLESSEGL